MSSLLNDSLFSLLNFRDLIHLNHTSSTLRTYTRPYIVKHFAFAKEDDSIEKIQTRLKALFEAFIYPNIHNYSSATRSTKFTIKNDMVVKGNVDQATGVLNYQRSIEYT